MQVEKKHARAAGNLHQRRQWRGSPFLEHRAIFEVKTEGCATIPILEKVSCGGLVTSEQHLLFWQAIPRSQPLPCRWTQCGRCCRTSRSNRSHRLGKSQGKVVQCRTNVLAKSCSCASRASCSMSRSAGSYCFLTNDSMTPAWQ